VLLRMYVCAILQAVVAEVKAKTGGRVDILINTVMKRSNHHACSASTMHYHSLLYCRRRGITMSPSHLQSHMLLPLLLLLLLYYPILKHVCCCCDTEN
jgi:hypothetical protein